MNKFNPNEFIVLQHRALNNKAPNLDKLAEYVYSLRKYTNGKIPVLALEGDLVEVKGELYLVHNYAPNVFGTLRERGMASYFEETLNYIKDHRPETVLNIELKPGITPDGMQKAVAMLRKSGLNNYLYDSFFHKELDIARETDPDCITSQHLFGYFYGLELKLGTPKHNPTIKTIPYVGTLGDPQIPMIYGMVNSPEKFARAADKENVYGASARFGDSNIFKIFIKSLSH